MSEMQQLWEDSHKYYSPKKGWKNRMVRSDRASQKQSSGFFFFGKCNISYSYFQLKSSGSIKISENFSEPKNKRRAYSRNKKM